MLSTRRLPQHLFVSLCIFVSAGCESQRLEGTITDPFGVPIPGATARIEKTGFSATGDASGRYSLDYAPGQFTVVFSKPGYTSESLPLAIQQKVTVPVQVAVLYPVPSEPGIYTLTNNGLRLVGRCGLNRSLDPPGKTSLIEKLVVTYLVEADGAAPIAVPHGDLIFVDNVPYPVKPYKLRTDPNAGLGIARKTSSEGYDRLAGDSTVHYDGSIEESEKRVGLERLLLRTVKAEQGATYAWLPTMRNPITKDILDESKPCFYFSTEADVASPSSTAKRIPTAPLDSESTSGDAKGSRHEANRVGRLLYDQHCAACHQANGAGIPPAFPSLVNSPALLAPPQDLIVLLRQGRGLMPAFPSLSDQDLNAIIAYARNSWGNSRSTRKE